MNLDGSFIYVPNPGYYGPDNFSYLANNGFFSSLVTRVSINVTQIIDQPLTVSIVGMTTNGCNLQLSGPAPATYVIFASPDLQNWTPVSTNAITTGKLSFTDTAATNYPNCFYKAVARKSW